MKMGLPQKAALNFVLQPLRAVFISSIFISFIPGGIFFRHVLCKDFVEKMRVDKCQSGKTDQNPYEKPVPQRDAVPEGEYYGGGRDYHHYEGARKIRDGDNEGIFEGSPDIVLKPRQHRKDVEEYH